jgi:hypothetical protein
MVSARWCNCPYSERSIEVVREVFPEHVILLRGELPWPARSPDLTASDYFLWGYIKAKLYTVRSRIIDDFKIAILEQISSIPENMARRALGKLQARLEECVRCDGQHPSERNKQRRN